MIASGLIPGAGGTQRLPRIVGLEIAVNMIVSGEPVRAADLAQTSLFDRVVPDNLLDAAQSFADRKKAAETFTRLTSMQVASDPHEVIWLVQN